MLNYYERYQPDIMIAFNDLAKEAEAIGCRVKYSDYVVPSIDQHVLQDDKGKLARLEIPDPKRDGRLPAFLEQCAALSGGQDARAGSARCNVGPWTIAMLMRNPELMCLDTIDDPEFVHELMRFATEYAKRVGRRRARDQDRAQLLGPDRLLLAGGARHVPRVHQALPQGPGGLLQGQEGRHDRAHLRHHPPDPRGPDGRGVRGDHHRSRPAGAIPALKVDQLDKLVTLGNQRGRGGHRQRRRDHLRARDPGGDRGRGAALHRHGRARARASCCPPPASCRPRANPDCVRWFMEAAREYGRYERILAP